MSQQDISLSPLLLPSPNPISQHKTGKYMIPREMPPLLMLNEPNHHDDNITNRRILTKVKLTSMKANSLDTSNSCNNYNQMKELKRERGYTILDMLELICK